MLAAEQAVSPAAVMLLAVKGMGPEFTASCGRKICPAIAIAGDSLSPMPAWRRSRSMRVTSHVARNTNGRSSARDRRTDLARRLCRLPVYPQADRGGRSAGSRRSPGRRRQSCATATSSGGPSPSRLRPTTWCGCPSSSRCQCRSNFPQKCRSKIPQFRRSDCRGGVSIFRWPAARPRWWI